MLKNAPDARVSEDAAPPAAPPLGPVAWLLLPAVAFALLGVAVPVWRDASGTGTHTAAPGEEFEDLALPESGPERDRAVEAWAAGWIAGVVSHLASTGVATPESRDRARDAWAAGLGSPLDAAAEAAFEEGWSFGHRESPRAPRAFAAGAPERLVESPALLRMWQELESGGSASTLFSSWQGLVAARADLEGLGLGASALERYDARLRRLLERVVALDPRHAEAREARGEAPYAGDLEPLLGRADLPETARTEILALHRRLAALAARNDGFVPREEMDRVDELLERHGG